MAGRSAQLRVGWIAPPLILLYIVHSIGAAMAWGKATACVAGTTWSASGTSPCTTCAATATCTAGVKTACRVTADTVCNAASTDTHTLRVLLVLIAIAVFLVYVSPAAKREEREESRTTAARSDSSRLTCAACLQTLPQTGFSSSQWKKGSARRCLECIAQGHRTASEGYKRHNTVATSTSGVDTTAMINAGASDIEIMEALGLVQVGATSSSGPGRVSGQWRMDRPNSGINERKRNALLERTGGWRTEDRPRGVANPGGVEFATFERFLYRYVELFGAMAASCVEEYGAGALFIFTKLNMADLTDGPALADGETEEQWERRRTNTVGPRGAYQLDRQVALVWGTETPMNYKGVPSVDQLRSKFRHSATTLPDCMRACGASMRKKRYSIVICCDPGSKWTPNMVLNEMSPLRCSPADAASYAEHEKATISCMVMCFLDYEACLSNACVFFPEVVPCRVCNLDREHDIDA